jgi:hypothetical protein
MIHGRSPSTPVFFRALPSFTLRWAVATPVIAVLQGALLLYGTIREICNHAMLILPVSVHLIVAFALLTHCY